MASTQPSLAGIGGPPIYAGLVPIAWVSFVLVLVSDIVYWRTANLFWQHAFGKKESVPWGEFIEQYKQWLNRCLQMALAEGVYVMTDKNVWMSCLFGNTRMEFTWAHWTWMTTDAQRAPWWWR